MAGGEPTTRLNAVNVLDFLAMECEGPGFAEVFEPGKWARRHTAAPSPTLGPRTLHQRNPRLPTLVPRPNRLAVLAENTDDVVLRKRCVEILVQWQRVMHDPGKSMHST